MHKKTETTKNTIATGIFTDQPLTRWLRLYLWLRRPQDDRAGNAANYEAGDHNERVVRVRNERSD